MSSDAGHSEEDIAADKVLSELYKNGTTQHELVECYNKWAENGEYDAFTCPDRYTGPQNTAMRVAEFFPGPERQNVRILDVAAGTGRVGTELYNRGFWNIDALDPSDGMLMKAKEKGVYTNFIQDFIGDDHKVPVDDDHYDGITSCGSIGEGHIPASAMKEMIRIVRPGGLICLTMQQAYLPEFQSTVIQLEAEGKWKLKSSEPAAGKCGDQTIEATDLITSTGGVSPINTPYSVLITGVGRLPGLIALRLLLSSQPWTIPAESPQQAPQSAMYPAHFAAVQTRYPQGQPQMYAMATAWTTVPTEKSQGAHSYY